MHLKKLKEEEFHTFISTSDLHMKFKLKMKKEEVLEAIKKSVIRSKNSLTILNGPLKMLQEQI